MTCWLCCLTRVWNATQKGAWGNLFQCQKILCAAWMNFSPILSQKMDFWPCTHQQYTNTTILVAVLICRIHKALGWRSVLIHFAHFSLYTDTKPLNCLLSTCTESAPLDYSPSFRVLGRLNDWSIHLLHSAAPPEFWKKHNLLVPAVSIYSNFREWRLSEVRSWDFVLSYQVFYLVHLNVIGPRWTMTCLHPFSSLPLRWSPPKGKVSSYSVVPYFFITFEKPCGCISVFHLISLHSLKEDLISNE